jgi:hypothetical protein
MRQGEEPAERNDALRDALERWDAEQMPAGAHERMLARYRREYVPWWRGWFVTPLRIALPVAVSLLLVAAAALVARRSGPAPTPAEGPVAAPTTVAAAAERVPAPRGSLAGFQPLDEVTATVVTERP